jgi:uncharacterized protein YjbJ (UPF0337 family)
VNATVEAVHDKIESVADATQHAVQKVSDTFNMRRQFDQHPWLFIGGAVVVGYLSVGPRREQLKEPESVEPTEKTKSRLDRLAATFVSSLEPRVKNTLWVQLQDLAVRAVIGVVKELAARRSHSSNGSGIEDHSFHRSFNMNWDQVEGNWKQFSGKVKEKWGKLTDDDLTAISGKREQLTGILQARYGYAKEQAERELNDFLNQTKA